MLKEFLTERAIEVATKNNIGIDKQITTLNDQYDVLEHTAIFFNEDFKIVLTVDAQNMTVDCSIAGDGLYPRDEKYDAALKLADTIELYMFNECVKVWSKEEEKTIVIMRPDCLIIDEDEYRLLGDFAISEITDILEEVLEDEVININCTRYSAEVELKKFTVFLEQEDDIITVSIDTNLAEGAYSLEDLYALVDCLDEDKQVIYSLFNDC